nr:Sec-independent protein translocase subunit TatA [uncultured Actinotalea sp.]
MRPGTMQIVILVLIILLLFGARRLPDLARSVGQSLKIFKSEVKDLQDDRPRAVEPRREEDRPAADGTAPPAAAEHRAADSDRGPTT